jgi:hypothetical protein
MSDLDRQERKRAARYRRARIRHFLFTHGPNRLSRGRVFARHQAQTLVIHRLQISSPLWPAAFDGLRIGHVSDFHLGDLLPIDRALQVVEDLAGQKPDLIACTGDVVDLDHREAGPLLSALAAIRAPLGAALVLGNHDELHCPRTLSRMADAAGMIVLHNEAIRIRHNGDSLMLAGIDWARSAAAVGRMVDAACGEASHLLLAHNPKAFIRAADLGIPLTLSGHTHGGQIAMRGRPKANIALARRTAGLYHRGDSRLYITTGVGAWFPLRLNCPPEVAVITMRHEAATDRAEPDPRRRRRRRA